MSWSRLLFEEQSSTIKFVSFCELAPIVNLVKIASGKNSPLNDRKPLSLRGANYATKQSSTLIEINHSSAHQTIKQNAFHINLPSQD